MGFIPQRNLFNFLGSTLIYLGRGKAKGKSEKCEAPIADFNAGASLLLRAHKSSSQDGDVALNKGSQGARAGENGALTEGRRVGRSSEVEGSRVGLGGRAAC